MYERDRADSEQPVRTTANREDTNMVTMHETTRLGPLLDSLTADTVDLDTNAPGWCDETCAKLLESIITGTPIGMITIAVWPQGRCIADGRRRLQVLVTASAATPDRRHPRFDVDLDSRETQIRSRSTGALPRNTPESTVETGSGRWFPVEALRCTEQFHEALKTTTRGTNRKVAERRVARAHELATRFHEYGVPITRLIDCDEAATARIRATLNQHRAAAATT